MDLHGYDIYRVNDDLVETLTAEKRIVPVSYEFSQIKSNAMKVKFVLRFLCKYNRIPDLQLRRNKNAEQARILRQNGNKMFALKGVNLYKALELYNQSICMTEIGHTDFSIVLANRSAVYLELSMSDACMTNIRHARLSGYPEKMMDKLVKREMECMMSPNLDYKTENVLPAICHPLHKDLNFITGSLELRQTPEFGRHVVSTKRHEPGDVLAIEEPFTNILVPSLRYQRCWNCMEENEMNLLPCTQCTHAMFCSEVCSTTAMMTYHPYECPIMDYLLALFNKLHLIALRTTITSVLAFGSLKKIGEFLKKHGNKKVDAFSTPASSTELSGIYENHEQRIFHQLYSLQTNQDKRSNSDLFQRATIAAILFEHLVNHTAFITECHASEKAQNTLIELLYRFLQTSPTNFHSLTLVETDKFEDDTYGCASYPFASLLNHSCSPNILRVSLDRSIVIMALRVIQPGEQLFDNYGYHHCLQSVQMRQKNLQVQYHFTCKCVACQENYPQYANLVKAPIPDGVSQETIQWLQKYSMNICNSELVNFAKFLTDHDKHYPCLQLSSVQECMKMSLHILMKNVPLLQMPLRPYKAQKAGEKQIR